MYESGQKLSTLRIEVQVHLDDGSQFLGIFSLSQGQRVSDLMNDERRFIPVQLPDGSVVILRKTVIAKMTPLDQHIDKEKISDPYEILGVSRNISDEELRQFYHTLCSENHPDRVQSSGLSPKIAEMAYLQMCRINEAYERIMSMRQAQTTNSQDRISEPDPFT